MRRIPRPGRLPTELGLRFFVDALMQVGDLTEPERQSIEAQLSSVGTAQSVEAALGEAPTRAVGPDARRRRGADRQIECAAQAYRIRAAGAGTRAGGAGRPKTARSKTACSTLPPGVPTSALTEATNFLNARIRGRTLAEARLELETRAGRRAAPNSIS